MTKKEGEKMKPWMMIKIGCAVFVGLWLGTGWAAPMIKLGAHAPQTGGLAKHGMEQIKGVRVGAEEFEESVTSRSTCVSMMMKVILKRLSPQ